MTGRIGQEVRDIQRQLDSVTAKLEDSQKVLNEQAKALGEFRLKRADQLTEITHLNRQIRELNNFIEHYEQDILRLQATHDQLAEEIKQLEGLDALRDDEITS